MDSLEVDVDVNEAYIGQVSRHALRSGARRVSRLKVPSHVIAIVPSPTAAEATVKVRWHWSRRTGAWCPTWACACRFLGRSRRRAARAPKGVLVPPQAIAQRDGQAVVFVVDDGRRAARRHAGAAGRRPLKLRADGVKAGERVVLSPPPRCATARRPIDGSALSRRATRTITPPRRRRGQHGEADRDPRPVEGLRARQQKVEVLHHIDLDVEQGDFLALMGPSGSGKTTLLNLDRRARPAVARQHQRRWPAHRPARRGRAGEVARGQGRLRVPVLQPDADALGAAQRRAAAAADQALGRERKKRAAIALQLVGLADRASHKPTELSGGQQQRVSIARAIVSDPALLVCDEPTGDLDRQSAEDVLGLLRRSTATTARPS
jgi:putative ABC transport system ATP-binding protein